MLFPTFNVNSESAFNIYRDAKDHSSRSIDAEFFRLFPLGFLEGFGFFFVLICMSIMFQDLGYISMCFPSHNSEKNMLPFLAILDRESFRGCK